MPKDKKGLETETSETIDRIEGILSYFLSFVGRYLKTIWHYLLIPSFSSKNLNGRMVHAHTLSPLSFLTSSLLIFSLSYFRVLKELQNLNWISNEFKATIKHIVSYHDSIAESAFAFQIVEALFLMLPLVLFVALFAKINELLSILVRKRTTIEQQLGANSYFVGTVASMLALWSLPLLYFMANYNALETSSALEHTIGIVIMILAIGTIFTALFRHLQHAKNQYYKTWLLSLLVFVVSLLLYIIAIRVTLKLFLLG
ncbi:MAG: hypothetical protein ACJAVV_001943 [Alphaproteobacteria bacterium]|jgi:hypothetical protein